MEKFFNPAICNRVKAHFNECAFLYEQRKVNGLWELN